jgi:hypothetical protein
LNYGVVKKLKGQGAIHSISLNADIDMLRPGLAHEPIRIYYVTVHDPHRSSRFKSYNAFFAVLRYLPGRDEL